MGGPGWCPPGEQREKGPSSPCAPQPAVRAGALALPAACKGFHGHSLRGGRGSGCPPGQESCLPQGLNGMPAQRGHPGQCSQEASRTQDTKSTAWHVGAPRDASAPGPSRCPSLAHLFHYHQPPLLLSHLCPLGPFPPDVNHTDPITKTAGGRVRGGGAGGGGLQESGCSACLPIGRRCGKGVVELTHGSHLQPWPFLGPGKYTPGMVVGRARPKRTRAGSDFQEVHVYLRSQWAQVTLKPPVKTSLG